MHTEDHQYEAVSTREVDDVLREGTRIVCGTSDFAIALARFTPVFPDLAPTINALATANDGQGTRSLCFVLLREIWKRVPRPDHGFRPLPLPKPQRNDPCQCGSGLKYKQCCARLEGELPFEIQGLSLLRYVLDDLPTSVYRDLPFDYLSPEELAFVAEQWLAEGGAEQVTFLLVPLLAPVKKLDARHEAAVDTLGDAYLQLGLPEQRSELLERVMDADDPTLRCAAMHRRCTIYSDAGDWPAAWKLFARAERLLPDHPSLAQLETIMLASEGRTGEARERAAYWLARLARRELGAGGESLRDFLRQMSADPDAVLAVIHAAAHDDSYDEDEDDYDDDLLDAPQREEWVMSLAAVLEALPAPVSHYALSPANGDAGGLRADRHLLALEQRWHQVFERDTLDEDGVSDPWEETGWIDWLATHPLAWQSFAILDEVAVFIDETMNDNPFDDMLYALEADLTSHAFLLFETVIADNVAQGCRLAWGWLENRPALRLLDRYIAMQAGGDEELPLLEWLVGTLSPDDNQGRRERLVKVLLDRERAAEALAWCDRFPDDALGAMAYARVLALHQFGRRAEAACALTVARQRHPEFVKKLLAPNVDPALPTLYFAAMTAGRDDDAWNYRLDWLELWTRGGALEWLRQAAQF